MQVNAAQQVLPSLELSQYIGVGTGSTPYFPAGYDLAAVELTATNVQVVVALVNSKLVVGPVAKRESETRRITSAIARAIRQKPEFRGIRAIHIDYVSRTPDGGHTRIIDSIDFRRDPQDKFQHNITEMSLTSELAHSTLKG